MPRHDASYKLLFSHAPMVRALWQGFVAPGELATALGHLHACLGAPGHAPLRGAFVHWLRSVLLPNRFPGLTLSELESLQEIRAMLEKSVRRWTQEWKREGIEAGRLLGMKEGRKTGMEQGRQEGRREGLLEGIQQGRLACANLLVHQLEQRFGSVPESVRLRLAQASLDELARWGRVSLHADTLEVVFAD